VNLLSRKSELSNHVELIKDLFIKHPLLSVNELYMMFKGKYPKIKMSQPSFVKYFGSLNANTVSQHIHKATNKNNLNGSEHLISYLAKNIDEPVIKKKIVEIEKAQRGEKPETLQPKNSLKTSLLSYLVIFLVGSNMSYDLVSFLLGISKSYVYKLVHKIHDIGQLALSSIHKWSGKICVDEKYVKLKGQWHYIFSIVDAVSGIPLFVGCFDQKNALSWQVFFTKFKKLYGTPKLIISDGCPSLAKGRMAVYPNTSFQYCKFHKMRNLIKMLYRHTKDPQKIKRAVEKLKQVFSRETRGGRRKALLELEKMLYGEVGTYFQSHILKEWKHLTKSQTSNAAERWNRKIKKIVSGKYGLKSTETIQQLVHCLWFKELIINGKNHLNPESTMACLNISKICQELISKKHLERLFSIDRLTKVV
jgi:transposase-like protein